MADLPFISESYPRPGLWTRWRLALAVRRQRRKLGMLSERELHDMGLDRPIAIEEARRKLWDVPNHWRV